MASKMMIRSGGSSILTLIHRHLRPALAAVPTASTNIRSGTQEDIYSWLYLLPRGFGRRVVKSAYGCTSDAAGFSVLEEAARGRRKFAVAKEKNLDEESSYEDEDDSEMDDSIFDEFDEDDDDDSGDDDPLEMEDDDRRFGR